MTGETGLIARLEDELAEARADLAEARQELANRREAQGRAEERAQVLHDALEFERARTNRLEDEIRDLRRPWWRRLTGR
jgi:hypothetical protein